MLKKIKQTGALPLPKPRDAKARAGGPKGPAPPSPRRPPSSPRRVAAPVDDNLSHYQILATLFEDFRRTLAAAAEKNLRAGALMSKKSAMSLRGKPDAGGEQIMSRLWVGFPLRSDFYGRFAEAFANLPVESTVRLLLHFSPVNSAHFERIDPSYKGRVLQSSRANFSGMESISFDSWLETLKSFSLQSPGGEEQLELLLRMGELLVADMVSVCLTKSSADLLPVELREPLRAMAVDAFCYPFPSKRLPAAFVHALNRERHLAWCRVLWRVCAGNWSTLALFQEAGKHREIEVWRSFLHALSWITLDVDTPDSLIIGKRIVNELIGHIASLRKRQLLPVKAQMIDTLGSILHTCDFSKMWDLIHDIYVNVSPNEWDKGELKRHTLQLMAMIVSCGPRDFREREFNDFFSAKILKGIWDGKGYLLSCLVTLLRGKYVPNRPYEHQYRLPYSYVPFVGPNMIPMLKVVFRGIFERSKAIPSAVEGLDELVAIVLQLAAHSLKLANTQMLPFLLHEKIPIHQLIGVRALSVILNQDTGFWAAVEDGETLEGLTREALISNINVLVLKLMRSCEDAVGLASYGADARILPVAACVPRQTPLMDIATDSPHILRARKRLLNVIRTAADSRRADDAQRITMDMEKVSAAVHTWLTCCDDHVAGEDHGPSALLIDGSNNHYGVSGSSQGTDNAVSSAMAEHSSFSAASHGFAGGGGGHHVYSGSAWGGGGGGGGSTASGSGSSMSGMHSGAGNASSASFHGGIMGIAGGPGGGIGVGAGALPGPGGSVGVSGADADLADGATLASDDRSVILQMYRECVQLLPFVTTGDLVKEVVRFVDTLRHADEALAASVSYSMQMLIRARPAACRPMFEALLSSVNALDWNNLYGITTLLSQAKLVLDWWTYLHYTRSQRSSTEVDASVAAELEASVAAFLCHYLPDIRLLAIDLVVGLSALCSQRGVAFVIEVLESDVMERSRYAYLVHAGPRLDNNSPLPTIRQAAASPNMHLWGCVVAAIGHVAVDEAQQQNLSLLRHAVTHKTFSVTRNGGTGPHAHHTLRTLLSLSFSLLGVAAVTKANRQRWQEQSMVVAELLVEFLQQTNFFAMLLAAPLDSGTHRAIVSSVEAMHASSVATFANSLSSWYDMTGRSAMFGASKPKPRHLLVACFRRLSQVAGMSEVIARSERFRGLCVRVMSESAAVFDASPSKLSSFAAADYFLDDITFMINMCGLMRGEPPIFTQSGPLRRHLQPAALLSDEQWPVEARHHTLKMLMAWTGDEEFSRERLESDREDFAKRFAKHSSESRTRHAAARKLRRVYHVARQAIGALMAVGPVFEDDRQLNEATINWLLSLERSNVRVLRWLLAFTLERGSTFRMYVNMIYSKPDPAVQKLLIDAITDQFLDFSEDGSPQSGILSDLYTYIQSHSLKPAKLAQAMQTPFTEEDRRWQHIVEERCGVLWNLAFFGMENGISSVRERCLGMLARVAPWVHSPKSDPVRPFLASNLVPFFDDCKSKLNHKILESAHQLAIAVSAAMAKQHAAFVEEMWREAFYRSETTTAAQKRWALVFLLPWCDGIILDDPTAPAQARTNLHMYTPFLFLEKLFSYFTVPVIDVLGSELMSLWMRLAAAAPGNHSFIISYLVSKSTAFEDNIRVCKKIILHMYRAKPVETVAPFVYYLSFAGIKRTVGAGYFNEMSDLDLETVSTPAKQQQGPAVAPTVLDSDAKSIPRVAEMVLIDLMCDQPEPVLPHLHIILNYVLIEGYYYTIRTKLPIPDSITELLYWVMVAIKNALSSNQSVTTRTLALVASLEAMLTSYKLHSFRFEWAVHKYEKRFFRSSYSRSSGATGSMRGKTGFGALSSTPRGMTGESGTGSASGRSSDAKVVRGVLGGAAVRKDSNSSSRRAIALQAEMQYNEDYGELARWACGNVDISEFVNVMCQCLKIIRPKLIRKWGSEAFQWFAGSRDPRVAICAQEIYRAILDPVSAETMDAAALRLLEVLRSLEIVKVVSHAKDSRDPELALAVSKAEEILITYEAQIPILEDLFLQQRIFWVCVAILVCNHTIVRELHVHVYRMLLSLCESRFFARMSSESESMLRSFRKMATEWNFAGLQRLLYSGLYVRKTSDLAAQLLAQMPGFSLSEMVETSSCRDGLTVLAFLPWLLQKLDVARVSLEDEYPPLEIAKLLIEALKSSSSGSKLPVTIRLLSRYAQGELGASDDDEFLLGVAGELHTVFFHNNAAELCQTLATIMQTVLTSRPVYYRNLVRTMGAFLAKSWSEKDYLHWGKIIRMASQSLQQDSSRMLMSLLAEHVPRELDGGLFLERVRAIPHLTGTSGGASLASKLIVNMLKAKLPKTVTAFRSAMRKQTMAAEKRQYMPPPPKPPLSPRGASSSLSAASGARKLTASRSAKAPPVAPIRQLGAIHKAKSLGRGTGRGVPRKPVPVAMRQQLPVGKVVVKSQSASSTSPEKGSGRSVAPPSKPLPSIRPSASKSVLPSASSGAVDTDEEEEPSQSQADDDEEMMDEDEYRIGATTAVAATKVGSPANDGDDGDDDDNDNNDEAEKENTGSLVAEMFLRTEAILDSSRMRPFFEAWMPADARPTAVRFVFDVQAFNREPNSEAAAQLARDIVEHYVQASPMDLPISSDMAADIVAEFEANPESPPSNMFAAAVRAALDELDKSVLQQFRASDDYLGLLSQLLCSDGDAFGNNPFLAAEESTEHPDDDEEGAEDDEDAGDEEDVDEDEEEEEEEQNPYVGGDIDELADLAQNLGPLDLGGLDEGFGFE